MNDSHDYCKICECNKIREPNHNDCLEHRFNFAIFEYYEYRKKLLRDRHGIIFDIQPKLENNIKLHFDYLEKNGKYVTKILGEQLCLHDNLIKFQCNIQNKRKDLIYVVSVKLLHPSEVFSIHYDKSNHFGTDNELVLALEPGSSYKFGVNFYNKEVTAGSFKIPVVCNFQTINNQCFTIPRSIVIVITDDEYNKEEKKKSPFTSRNWTNITKSVDSIQKLHYQNRYPIPENYLKFLKFGLERFKNITQYEETVLTKLQNIVKGLNKTNYKQFWHTILWLEEVAQSLMLQKYNMENVTLVIKNDNILILEVPGLAEKRPSVIVGDFIKLRVHEDHTEYTGVVKRVNDATVEIYYIHLELINYIRLYPDTPIDVAFILSRLSFERMHEGVDKVASKLIDVVFPFTVSPNGPQRNLNDDEFYDKTIIGNSEQRKAVNKIINSNQIAPYIVFGPPGTGKTVTIVEAILHIKKNTTKRILVCAPANSACDNIAIKLLPYCKKSELIRVHSDTRDITTITDELKEYSNIEEEGMFKKLSTSEIMRFRIVITTLTLIGRQRDYIPDCVFVDEAAQASEPETDIALGFAHQGKLMVLAGDPKQLGPMVSSKCAEKFGLGVSLLERLMNLEIYSPDQKTGLYNSNLITMLKLNYRSHELILHIPNKLFYGNSLKAMSRMAHDDPLGDIAIYPRIYRRGTTKKMSPGCAIEFCSVSSKERREGSSPSYFNTFEVKMVLDYIKTLLGLTLKSQYKVTLNDIGVVTPYKRQVHKIKDTLKRNGFEGIEVGTTESYQGREKRIIIISSVRAQDSLLLHDRKYNLGFVRHDQRFNVAITRAISKLIIIGCQPVLTTDTKWRMLIRSCIENRTYFGAPYVERTRNWKSEVVENMKHFKNRDDQHHH